LELLLQLLVLLLLLLKAKFVADLWDAGSDSVLVGLLMMMTTTSDHAAFIREGNFMSTICVSATSRFRSARFMLVRLPSSDCGHRPGYQLEGIVWIVVYNLILLLLLLHLLVVLTLLSGHHSMRLGPWTTILTFTTTVTYHRRVSSLLYHSLKHVIQLLCVILEWSFGPSTAEVYHYLLWLVEFVDILIGLSWIETQFLLLRTFTGRIAHRLLFNISSSIMSLFALFRTAILNGMLSIILRQLG
jgi:hypothetical protein